MWPAARALSSAPNLAESHTADAFVKFWLDWDLPVAEQGFRRALELDPSDALAHRTLGIVYLDRRQEARAFAAMACQLDPLNAAHHALRSQKAFFGREYEQSLQYATQAIALDRDFWVGHLQLAQAAEQLGQHAVALEALDQAGTFSGNNSKVLALKGYLLAKCGSLQEAEEILGILHAQAAQRFVPPYAEALIQIGLQQPDQAMLTLEARFRNP